MTTIKPLQGIRFNLNLINDMSKVVTPPYDVISPQEQEAYYRIHPYNIIRLTKGKDESGDNDQSNKYTRAASDFKAWYESGILRKESKPAIYIYEQVFDLNGKINSRKGFIANVKLEELKTGHIFPHEQTLSGPKTDRFNLIKACSANFSPVFSLYPDVSNEKESVNKIIDSSSVKVPDVSFIDDKGVKNTLWVLSDISIINDVITLMNDKPLFIADGHHRYETALAYRNKVRKETGKEYGKNEQNDLAVDYVMMMCVSMNNPGLKILPAHRVIKDVNGLDCEKIKNKLSEIFKIQPVDVDNPVNCITKILSENADQHAFILYIGDEKKFYLLTITKERSRNILFALEYSNWKYFDVGILHGIVFDKLFEIKQIPSKNEAKIEYVKNEIDAISMVNEDGYRLAFFLNPTRIEDVQMVANDRQIMPPKSTYFYPKLTTGVVISKL